MIRRYFHGSRTIWYLTTSRPRAARKPKLWTAVSEACTLRDRRLLGLHNKHLTLARFAGHTPDLSNQGAYVYWPSHLSRGGFVQELCPYNATLGEHNAHVSARVSESRFYFRLESRCVSCSTAIMISRELEKFGLTRLASQQEHCSHHLFRKSRVLGHSSVFHISLWLRTTEKQLPIASLEGSRIPLTKHCNVPGSTALHSRRSWMCGTRLRMASYPVPACFVLILSFAPSPRRFLRSVFSSIIRVRPLSIHRSKETSRSCPKFPPLQSRTEHRNVSSKK